MIDREVGTIHFTCTQHFDGGTYLRPESECVDIYYGVPQGSILGPRLFLLYINSLHLFIKNIQFTMYADDLSMIISNLPRKNLEKIPKRFNK